MNYKIILIIISIAFSGVSFSKDKEDSEAHNNHKGHKNHDHSDQEATLQKVNNGLLVVKVKGMVCAFCAQGIEKNFNSQEEVKMTKVDLDKMEVTIHLKTGKTLSDKTIEKIVTDAGFKFVGVKE